MHEELFPVVDKAVKDEAYIVAQGTNGMTYTGKTIGYDKDRQILLVMYEKDDGGNKKQFQTDLYLSNLCSLQLTTLEEIERIRSKKRGHSK